MIPPLIVGQLCIGENAMSKDLLLQNIDDAFNSDLGYCDDAENPNTWKYHANDWITDTRILLENIRDYLKREKDDIR